MEKPGIEFKVNEKNGCIVVSKCLPGSQCPGVEGYVLHAIQDRIVGTPSRANQHLTLVQIESAIGGVLMSLRTKYDNERAALHENANKEKITLHCESFTLSFVQPTTSRASTASQRTGVTEDALLPSSQGKNRKWTAEQLSIIQNTQGKRNSIFSQKTFLFFQKYKFNLIEFLFFFFSSSSLSPHLSLYTPTHTRTHTHIHTYINIFTQYTQ